MVQTLCNAMGMVIVLAKMDLMVKPVMNANQITSVFRHAKVCLKKWFSKSQPNPSVSDCNCYPDGSTALQCDADGDCACKDGFDGKTCDACKEGFTGNKCDECKPNYFDYPSCQGLSKSMDF